jgi:REP element-mobilizing transposase RayT
MTSHPAIATHRTGHAALRKGRRSQAQQVYHITLVTHRRQPLFADFPIGCAAANALVAPDNWGHARLLAWVLMPDHWHALVELRDDTTLSKLVQELKCNIARKLREAQPDIGQVWARAFHDRALRRDDDLFAAARYLVMNPIRAGLTRKVREYPFWDAVWL